MENFRRFQAVDPYGRAWQVEFRWQQNAISIRHGDTVDVKFQLIQGDDVTEKVVALNHPDLLTLSKAGRARDRCVGHEARRAAPEEMIETDRDMEKTSGHGSLEDLERYNAETRRADSRKTLKTHG